MIQYFFKPVFYIPLYNGLIFLIHLLPNYDVGLAVILFTVLVKLILFPLTKKSLVTQAKLKKLEPQLADIRKKYEKDKQEQARVTMAFYKENNINPFSGFWLLLIQTPIILSLYYIFLRGGLPTIDTSITYPFIPIPQNVSMIFLGLNIGLPNLILAIIAGVSQFFQIRFSVPAYKKPEGNQTPTFRDDLARSMNLQFRYILPVIIFLIGLKVSGAVALYWITSNLFIIGQELVIRKRFIAK